MNIATLSRYQLHIRPCMVAIAILASFSSAHADETPVAIPTRPGVTQSFVANIPVQPVATVIMFPGGKGSFNVEQQSDGGIAISDQNFLIRTRQMFANAHIAVIVLNSPSDRPNGMNEAFRTGGDHAMDVAATIAWARQHVDAPVWLVGTSTGSISAAANAISAGTTIGGVVLTSPISVKGRIAPAAGVSALALDGVRVPAFVMADSADACPASPPANAAVMAGRMTKSPRAASSLIPGGSTPRSGPCGALSYHGFYGVEAKAVDAIVSFIKSK